MSIKSIEQDFIDKVSSKIKVIPDGKDRFRVFTPFRFDDGDHISIVLKKRTRTLVTLRWWPYLYAPDLRY